MDFVFELEHGEILGVAAVIINALREDKGEFDINYVFSEQFRKDLRKHHYNLDDKLIEDWHNTLVYYDAVKEHIKESIEEENKDSDEEDDPFEKYEELRDELGYEFGFLRYKGIKYTGIDIAAYAIFHMRTHLYPLPEDYLDEMVRAKHITKLDILVYKDDLETGAGYFTLYDSSSKEELSIKISSVKWMHIPSHNEFGFYTSVGDGSNFVHLGRSWSDKGSIRGFIAALLGIVFHAENRRFLLSYDLTDYWYVKQWDEQYSQRKVDVQHLPTKLGVPAKRLIEAYFPKAFDIMAAKLAEDDIAYDETREYSIRKLLEMELEQARTIAEDDIWQMLQPKFREMILAYHALFVKFLREQIGEDEAHQTQEQSTTPAQDLFTYITDEARRTGKAPAVEAELRAACQGTAGTLWKAVRVNESLGYLQISQLGTAAIYRAFSGHFGQLPYTERNFRLARANQ